MKAEAPSAAGSVIAISGMGVRLSAVFDVKGLLSAFEPVGESKTPCRLVPPPRKSWEPFSEDLGVLCD